MDRVVAKALLEADPEFARFLGVLSGVSKLDDVSEVHVPSTGAKDSKKKDRRLAQTGLAATGVAGVGGTHALYLTGKEAAGRGATPGKHAAAEEAPKLLRKLPLKPKTLAAAGVAGWAALHTTELAGDALAARAQMRAIQATDPPGGAAKKPVVKRAGHFQPIGNVHANARAKVIGLRPTASSNAVPRPRQPPMPGVVTKAMFTKVGEEFVAGARPIKPKVMGGRHAKGGGPRQPSGRHQAEMPKRALTLQGKATAIGVPTVGGLLGAAKISQDQRRPKQGSPIVKAVWRGEISKVDIEKRQVFGWASLSEIDGEMVLDRQGDYVPIDETEDSAYRYMLSSRKGGDMHARIGKSDGGPKHTADVIESMVFTPEKLEALGLEPDALPLGWWLGFQLHDEQQWQDVKAGRRLGLSVHGSGVRRELVSA